jgi:hypothetical protein
MSVDKTIIESQTLIERLFMSGTKVHELNGVNLYEDPTPEEVNDLVTSVNQIKSDKANNPITFGIVLPNNVYAWVNTPKAVVEKVSGIHFDLIFKYTPSKPGAPIFVTLDSTIGGIDDVNTFFQSPDDVFELITKKAIPNLKVIAYKNYMAKSPTDKTFKYFRPHTEDLIS